MDNDLPHLSNAQWHEVQTTLDTICDTGFNHPAIKVVEDARLPVPLWQMTVKGDHTDHRVFLDVQDNLLVVLAIWHADFTHSDADHWTDLAQRRDETS